MDSFCDPNFGLVLLPLFPPLLAMWLIDVSTPLFSTPLRYFTTIAATIVVLYILGGLGERIARALAKWISGRRTT